MSFLSCSVHLMLPLIPGLAVGRQQVRIPPSYSKALEPAGLFTGDGLKLLQGHAELLASFPPNCVNSHIQHETTAEEVMSFS